MRKILCDQHHAALHIALEARGLTPMISANDDEAEVRLLAHGFDPAVGALAEILGNIVLQGGGTYALLALEGCPLCRFIRIHEQTCPPDHQCQVSDTAPRFPEIAAEAQLGYWRVIQAQAGQS